MFAPVFLASGNAALALNVTFLLGLVLTATTMHVVVRRWTGSDLAGLVGATTLLLNQWILWGFVPRTPHWAALCLFPVIAFTAAKPFDSLRSSRVLRRWTCPVEEGVTEDLPDAVLRLKAAASTRCR
jgi:hypothetical protein